MRFNRITRIAAAVAVIGAVAAGGAAFTAGTGQPTTQAVGYGATTVTGGSITGITYQLNAAGDTITTVTLTTTEDLTTANNGALATVLLDFNGSNHFGTGGDAACVVQSGGKSVICTPNSTTTVASVTSEEIAITDGGTGNTFS